MISCEKARVICHKTQYNDASFWEIVKLKYHLLICRACSAFSKKNTKFTTLCDKATLHVLSDSEKAQMKDELQRSL